MLKVRNFDARGFRLFDGFLRFLRLGLRTGTFAVARPRSRAR